MPGSQRIDHLAVAISLSVLATLSAAPPAWADSPPVAFESCLLERLREASNELTVGELRRQCEADTQPGATSPEQEAATPADTPVERRVALEREAQSNPFAITPHKRNYVLPVTYNSSPNSTPFGAGTEIDRWEVKFQFSFKFPLFRNMFGGNGTLYAAYTNQSYWQAYNESESRPFRETNHEPELFVRFDNDWKVLGLTQTLVDLGISHQSNGRSGSLSRSWNRVFMNLVFERGDFALSLEPWFRIPESAAEDDNPDIDEFMGHGELRLAYAPGRQLFSIMLRNNLRSDNRGAVQLDWTFPLGRYLRGYVQYFNGYGESMIDYDASANRIGAGIVLTDWL